MPLPIVQFNSETMVREIKFPNGGYSIKVVRKEDIINTIDINITDKEVALALIEQLEIDAANFINSGRWTGIPNLGSIRIPADKVILRQQRAEGLLDEAKELLKGNEYILFRNQLAAENKNKAKNNRYYKYICSIAANHNRRLYSRLCNTYNSNYAQLKLYFGHTAEVVSSDTESNYEQS